jgi:hypothetical protein
MYLCSYTFVSAIDSLDSFDLLSVARQKYMVEYFGSFVERSGLCCSIGYGWQYYVMCMVTNFRYFRAVFLNRRALASIIPGRENLSF